MRIILVLTVLSLVSCKQVEEISSNKQSDSLENLDWMLGKWRKENTEFLELWSKRDQNYFGGMGVKLKTEKQAVIKEILSLESRANGIYLETKDNGRVRNSVEYKMVNDNFNSPTFVSNNSKYPQKISYMKIGSDKIKIEISSNDFDNETFYFIREM